MAVTMDGVAMTDQDLSFVQELINTGRFSEIGDVCDARELECAAKGLEKPADWPYAIHLLGHIYTSDLNSARFLWKRIPASLKQSQPEVSAVWKIGQSLWTYNYAGVHDALRSYNWSPLVQPIIIAFADDYLKKNMKLLSTAYSTITVADASKFLGLSEVETIKRTTQEGWILDPATNMLSAQSATGAASQKVDSSTLQNLTEYVFHLEH